MDPALQEVFKWRHYGQIRTIILPAEAHHILRACSDVVEVVIKDGQVDIDVRGTLVNAMKYCKQVEVLEFSALGLSEWTGQ